MRELDAVHGRRQAVLAEQVVQQAGAFAGREVQHPVVLQQLGHRPRGGAGVAAARHHRHVVAEQRLGLQALHGFLRPDAADHQVQAALAQPGIAERRQAVEHLQLHVRQLLAERRQHARQQRLRHPGRDAQGQALRGPGVAVARERVLGLAQLGQHALRMLEQLQPGGREGDPAPVAREERDARMGLQLAQALRDGGLGDAQRTPGGADAAFRRDGGEVAQLVELHGRPIMGSDRRCPPMHGRACLPRQAQCS